MISWCDRSGKPEASLQLSDIRNCPMCLLCSQGSCSKSFWDLPLVEGPGRHVHPKTTTFCLVLGFTPSREACRAHHSQNDLEQGYSAILITAKAQRPPPQIAIFWKISKNRGLELLFDPPGMRNGKKQDLKLPFELSTIIREGQMSLNHGCDFLHI